MKEKISLQSAFDQLSQYVRVASSSMLKLRDNLQLNWADHKRIKDLISQLNGSVPEMSDADFKAAISKLTPDLLNRMILVTDSKESEKKFIRKTEISPTYSMVVSDSDEDACYMYDREFINVLTTPAPSSGVRLVATKKGGLYTRIDAVSQDTRIVRPLAHATVLDNQTGECMLATELDVAGQWAILSNGGMANPNPIEVSIDPSSVVAYNGTPSPFNPLYGRAKLYINGRPYKDYKDNSGKRGCLVVPVDAKQFVSVVLDIYEDTTTDGEITSYCFVIYNDSSVRQCYCLTPTLQEASWPRYSMIVFKTDVTINEAKRETNLLCFQQLAGTSTAFQSPLGSVHIQGSNHDYYLRALLGALPVRSGLSKFNFVANTVTQI